MYIFTYNQFDDCIKPAVLMPIRASALMLKSPACTILLAIRGCCQIWFASSEDLQLLV